MKSKCFALLHELNEEDVLIMSQLKEKLGRKMKETVNEILREKSFCEDITSELKLNEDLGLDSLNLVELMVELEDKFNIEIDESDLDPAALQTVDQIYALVSKYTEGK